MTVKKQRKRGEQTLFVRFILLLLIIGLIILSLCVTRKRIKWISLVCLLIAVALLFNTFIPFVEYIPVRTKMDKSAVCQSVLSDFDFQTSVNEYGKGYYLGEGEESICISYYNFYRIPVEDLENDKLTPNSIIKSISDNFSYYPLFPSSDSKLIDRLFLKAAAALLTVKYEKDGISFWLLPTVLEPYNPNSFFFKGCTYSECYYNTVVWSNGENLFVIIEKCDFTNGKTDIAHFEQFIKDRLS